MVELPTANNDNISKFILSLAITFAVICTSLILKVEEYTISGTLLELEMMAQFIGLDSDLEMRNVLPSTSLIASMSSPPPPTPLPFWSLDLPVTFSS